MSSLLPTLIVIGCVFGLMALIYAAIAALAILIDPVLRKWAVRRLRGGAR